MLSAIVLYDSSYFSYKLQQLYKQIYVTMNLNITGGKVFV